MVEPQLVLWEALDRYMLRLKEPFNWSDSVAFHSCHERLNCRVCFGSLLHHGVRMFHITPGCTPFMFSRPVMDLLSITIECGASQVTVGRFDQAMHPATRGEKGHYVLTGCKFR